MNKKVIMILIISIVIVAVIFWILKKEKNFDNREIPVSIDEQQSTLKIIEKDGMFVVCDENGNEIARGEDKMDLEIYLKDPDYLPVLYGGEND